MAGAPLADLARATAPVLEVFRSIQGEGTRIGEPQVFVRLAGCPLRCAWCDTPESWVVPAEPRARILAPRGARSEPGIATPARAAAWVDELDPARTNAVSLTGGEPLAHPRFVLELRAALPGRELHLETAGAHPNALARVAPVVDHLSLDLKLPADLDTPVELTGAERERSPHDESSWRVARRGSLELAATRPGCLKLIVSGGRSADEFSELLDDAAELAPRLPLVLQPVTPTRAVAAPDAGVLMELADRAFARGLRPRVLPQIHPLLRLP